MSDEDIISIQVERLSTQLYYTCANGDLNRLKEIFKQCTPLIVNEWEYSDFDFSHMLITASEKGHLSIVKYLIEYTDASIHDFGNEPLHQAANHGCLNVVKYLIDQGADIQSHGDHVLYLAVNCGHMHIVKYLIQKFYTYNKISNIKIIYANKLPTLLREKKELYRQYNKMKFHVLLLYHVHSEKLPVELQKNIFDYI